MQASSSTVEVIDDILESEFPNIFSGGLVPENLCAVVRQINAELLMDLQTEDFPLRPSLDEVYSVVERNAPRANGLTIFDVYDRMKKMAQEEFHPDVPFRWSADWDDFYNSGNFLTRPDPLDAYEMQLRVERDFSIQFSDNVASQLMRVGPTVRMVWEALRLTLTK